MPGFIGELEALLSVPTTDQWFAAVGFCILYTAIGWALYSAMLRIDASDRARREAEAAEKKAAEKAAAPKKKRRRFVDENGVVFMERDPDDDGLDEHGLVKDDPQWFSMDPHIYDAADYYNWVIDHQKVAAYYKHEPIRKNGDWNGQLMPPSYAPVIDLTGNHLTTQRDGSLTIDVPSQYRDVDLTRYGYTYWYDGNNDYAHMDDNGRLVPGCPKVIVPVHYSRFFKDENGLDWDENDPAYIGWNEYIEPKDLSFDDSEDEEAYGAEYYAPYGSVPASFAFKLKADLEMQDSTKEYDDMLEDLWSDAPDGMSPKERRLLKTLKRRLEWDADVVKRMPGKVRKTPPSGSPERAGDDPRHGDWIGC